MVLFRRRRIKWLDSLGYDRDRIQKRKFSGLTIFFTGLLCMTLHSKWNSINTRIEEDISHDLSKTDLHGAVRRLLATDNETHHLPLWEECSAEQSTSFSGLFVFTHSLGILIIFVALAIVCDDFFVPSLEAISEKLRLSEDVAGATFMAAGSSAPELFTSIAGVAFETDVGVGTIVGSAVFNILIIIALTAALAGQVLNLDWRPLIRDSFCYAVSIILFIQFAWDGEFTLYEAIILLVLYILYILLMVINPKLMDWMAKWRCICKKKAEVLPIDAELGKRGSQDGGQTNVDMVNGGSQILKEPPKPVVSFAGGHARRLSLISQGSMSNMPDKHYFQHQRGSIMGALTFPAKRPHMTIEEQIEERSSEESEHDSKSDREEEEVRKEEEKEDTQDKVSETNTVDDEAGMVNLCPCFPCCPKVNVAPPERGGPGCWEAVKIVLRWFIYIVSFPFVILFTWTIPDCSQEHNKKWFLVSFFMAVLWIAILSFVMVLLVGRTGCILHIDSFVMGLVIIAVGTSVPDALSSILVAREGYGDMAVSNAIGSNVFDINLGLGLPFLITIAIKGGASLRLLNEEQQDAFDAGLMLLTPHAKFGFILLFILAMCLSIFLMARFRLTKGIGISFVIIYVLFMVYAFVQELVCRGKC